MNCPYCNKEMELGVIQSPQEIAWRKGTDIKMFGRAAFHKDTIVLSRLAPLKGSKVDSYLCSRCRKKVIEY